MPSLRFRRWGWKWGNADSQSYLSEMMEGSMAAFILALLTRDSYSISLEGILKRIVIIIIKNNHSNNGNSLFIRHATNTK